MSRPLAGLKVIDFSRFLAGPYCTLVLAELGADVVKVERPGLGDDSRHMAPQVNGESYPFGMVNRSKRSIAIDLQSTEGKQIALDLIATADIVIENFRPGVADRLGLGYSAATSQNNRIIYCSISGFGQTGPYKHRPGMDIMAQGLTGFMTMTGNGDEPAKVGIAISDIAAGSTAIYSILAAVINRTNTGDGQYLDISLVESGLAWTVWEAGAYFGGGEIARGTGTRHRRSAPYQAFRTSDGHVTISAANPKLWGLLIRDVLHKPEWDQDPRFSTASSRIKHVDELESAIEEITQREPTDYWVHLGEAAGIPCGPVLTYDKALDHPQLADRQAITEMLHPTIGPMKTISPPTKFSSIQYTVKNAPPVVGEHTSQILEEIGVERATIERLARDGVLGQPAEG